MSLPDNFHHQIWMYPTAQIILWSYCQQAQCKKWFTVKHSKTGLQTSNHPQNTASHLLRLQGPQQTPDTKLNQLTQNSKWRSHEEFNIYTFALGHPLGTIKVTKEVLDWRTTISNENLKNSSLWQKTRAVWRLEGVVVHIVVYTLNSRYVSNVKGGLLCYVTPLS